MPVNTACWDDAQSAIVSLDTPAILPADILRRFDVSGPRYTSYPTADRFVEAFDAAAYRHWLQNRNVGGFARPLGLYVHLPFCGTICYYCGCNKIVTKDHGRSAKYLKYLAREARLVAECLGTDRAIGQLQTGQRPSADARTMSSRTGTRRARSSAVISSRREPGFTTYGRAK